MKEGGITRKHIEQAVEYVLKEFEPKKERFIKLQAYCKDINGLRDYTSNKEGICSYVECVQCRSFETLYQEELMRQINNLENEQQEFNNRRV